MGDIKFLTAYKLGHPAMEHPITVVLRGREVVLETRELQANYKGRREQRASAGWGGAASVQSFQELG